MWLRRRIPRKMYKSTLQCIMESSKKIEQNSYQHNNGFLSEEKMRELEQFARDEAERRRIFNLSPEELVDEIAPMYDRIIRIYAQSGLTHLVYDSIYNIYDVYNKKDIVEPCVANRQKICELMMKYFDGCKVYFERFYDYDSILCEWTFHIDWE